MSNFLAGESRLAYRPASTSFEWLLAILFLVMVPITPGWMFFYSHVFFIGFVYLVGIKLGMQRSRWALSFLGLLLLLLINFALALRGGTEGRFVQDTAKLALLFTSLYLVVVFFSYDFCLSLLKKFIGLFPFVFVFYFAFIFEGNMFSYSGRLYSPLFGSPNVVGVFCGLALIFIFAFRSSFSSLAFVGLLAFYTVVLALGFSRAAILGTAGALLFLFRPRGVVLLIFASVLALVVLFVADSIHPFIPDWVWQKGNIANDLQETGGSYRTLIWQLALERFISDPVTLIFGEGVGRSILIAKYDFVVEHPHNFYIFLMLADGVIFFFVFVVLWGRALIWALQDFAIGNKIRLSLFIFYSLIFVMDTHVIASQFFIPHVLFVSLLLAGRTQAQIDPKSNRYYSDSCEESY